MTDDTYTEDMSEDVPATVPEDTASEDIAPVENGMSEPEQEEAVQEEPASEAPVPEDAAHAAQIENAPEETATAEQTAEESPVDLRETVQEAVLDALGGGAIQEAARDALYEFAPDLASMLAAQGHSEVEVEPSPVLEVVSVDALLSYMAETTTSAVPSADEGAANQSEGEVVETVETSGDGETETDGEEQSEPVLSFENQVTMALAQLRDNTMVHPMMTTPFEEYSVTEGLLLLCFLLAFVKMCAGMLRGALSWLR